MAVDTDTGAARSTQLSLFDKTLPLLGNSAADESRDFTRLRFLFIQTEVLQRARRLSMTSRPTLDDTQSLLVAQFAGIYGNERTLRK